MNKKANYLVIVCVIAILAVSAFSALYMYPKIRGHQLGQSGYALITFTYTPQGIIVKNIGTSALDNFTFEASLSGSYSYFNVAGGFPLSLAPQQSVTTNWFSWYGANANLTAATITSGTLGYNNLHNYDHLNPSNANYPYPTYNFTYNANYGWYVRLTP